MNGIENLLKSEIVLARQNMILQLLDKFGDRLPKDIQNEMRKEAKFESRVRRKLEKRVENSSK